MAVLSELYDTRQGDIRQGNGGLPINPEFVTFPRQVAEELFNRIASLEAELKFAHMRHEEGLKLGASLLNEPRKIAAPR